MCAPKIDHTKEGKCFVVSAKFNQISTLKGSSAIIDSNFPNRESGASSFFVHLKRMVTFAFPCREHFTKSVLSYIIHTYTMRVMLITIFLKFQRGLTNFFAPLLLPFSGKNIPYQHEYVYKHHKIFTWQPSPGEQILAPRGISFPTQSGSLCKPMCWCCNMKKEERLELWGVRYLCTYVCFLS